MTREEEIKQASENYYNEVKYLSDLSAFPIAAFKAGAEWADRTMLDKVCEWLKSYRQDTHDGTGYIAGIVNDKTIEDLRKTMKK